MDKLVITDIKLTTLIGSNDWEQIHPQNIHIDIAIQTNVTEIAKEDNIHKAINYELVLKHIVHFVKSHHYQLIETLAEHLANEILFHFPTQWVQITIHKPGALLDAKDIAITIERSK